MKRTIWNYANIFIHPLSAFFFFDSSFIFYFFHRSFFSCLYRPSIVFHHPWYLFHRLSIVFLDILRYNKERHCIFIIQNYNILFIYRKSTNTNNKIKKYVLVHVDIWFIWIYLFLAKDTLICEIAYVVWISSMSHKNALQIIWLKLDGKKDVSIISVSYILKQS